MPGQDLSLPPAHGASQPGGLGNAAAVRPGVELGQRHLGVVEGGGGVDVTKQLLDGPGVVDLVAGVTGGPGGLQPLPLPVGKPFGGLERTRPTP